jgi:hypothetical protein
MCLIAALTHYRKAERYLLRHQYLTAAFHYATAAFLLAYAARRYMPAKPEVGACDE